MKVKITLRFRGREMAHKEFGFQQVEKFVASLTPYGHPDAPPKLIGKGINVMFSPLPRAKRRKNPPGRARSGIGGGKGRRRQWHSRHCRERASEENIEDLDTSSGTNGEANGNGNGEAERGE